MKTAIYIRVSTEEQATKGYSVDGQRNILTEHVNTQGWEIYDYYIDDGYSAKDLKRPQMQRMIEDIKKKKFDVVLIYKLDRLVRTVLDLHELLMMFDQYHVKFKSATELFDTTSAMGRFFITLVGAMAQWERENLAERVYMGMKQKLLKGERNGGVAPYGYDLVDGNLVINESEAAIVRRIFRDFKSKGKRGIAFELNRESVSKRGAKWSYNTVNYILNNPIYCGKLRWNYRKATGKRTFEEILSEGSHEPIVSEEEFEYAQKIMEQRSIKGKQATSDYPFTGVLRCKRCGYTLVGASRKRKNDRLRYYKCVGRVSYGVCDLPMINEEVIEKEFIKSIEWSMEQIEVAATKEPEENIREILERELKEIKKRKQKWQYAFANDAISLEDLKSLNEKENERENQIRKELEELHEEKNDWTTEEVAQFLQNLKLNWHHYDNYTKKEFVNQLFEQIVIDTHVVNPKGGPGKMVPVEIVDYKLRM